MQEFEYEKLIKASRKIYMLKDVRNGLKAKRRTTNLSQNQSLQNKSMSPLKKERSTVAPKIPSTQPTPASQVEEKTEMKMV